MRLEDYWFDLSNCHSFRHDIQTIFKNTVYGIINCYGTVQKRFYVLMFGIRNSYNGVWLE